MRRANAAAEGAARAARGGRADRAHDARGHRQAHRRRRGEGHQEPEAAARPPHRFERLAGGNPKNPKRCTFNHGKATECYMNHENIEE